VTQKYFRPLQIVVAVIALLAIFHQPLLNQAGDFLAPSGKGSGEVTILEGTATIQKGAVKEGMTLLKKATDRLVIVLHLPEEKGQLFAIQEEYPRLLKKELRTLGLRDEQLEIMTVPINDHPITLTEARFVMAALAKEGIGSAVLVSEGFHTRRSWAVYQQEGKAFHINVTPHPCFIKYKEKDWWRQKEGVRDFAQESVKLLYYLFFGYVGPQYVFSSPTRT
jgi:hypothetical protein